MATPLTERPQPPAPEIRSLPKGVRHAVSAHDSWVSLAQSLGSDPWDLIEFNFPGVKQVKQADTERATRQVNWYLSEYLGCQDSNDGGRNYAFGAHLAGRGRGDYRGGVIYLPPRPKTSACPFDIRDAVTIESVAAARVRALSRDIASGFIGLAGAVGRRGRFIPTILDNKYWFAKLYEIVTIHEINEARNYREPAFVLHFIPIFYDLYNQALQSWLNKNRAAVGRMWTTHFTGAADPDNSSVMSWTRGVQHSIESGVTAHVRGDMPIALERAYHSYTAKYCLDPPPAFDQFRADFFAMGAVFDHARKILLSHVAQMGPVPEAAVDVGERLFSNINTNVVDGWRKEAWDDAQRRIDRSKLRSHGSFPVPAGTSTQ